MRFLKLHGVVTSCNGHQAKRTRVFCQQICFDYVVSVFYEYSLTETNSCLHLDAYMNSGPKSHFSVARFKRQA